MNMLLLATALCAVFTSAFSESVAYEDCGSKLANISKVEVDPCPSLPCQLKKGTNASFSVHFIPNVPVKEAKIRVFGILNNVHVPFSMPDEEVCSSVKCPMEPEKLTIYNNTIFVHENYPAIPLKVKVRLETDEGDLVCFKLPVVITSS